MEACLRSLGLEANTKRVRRLLRTMGLEAIHQKPNTSKPNPEHKVYPYLLRGLVIDRCDQVWSTDITYVRLASGFVYLVAVIDWYSRYVLGWALSTSLWMRTSALKRWGACWNSGSVKYATRIKARGLPPRASPCRYWIKALRLAWTGAAGHWTISLWNGSGGRSNIKMVMLCTGHTDRTGGLVGTA